MVNTLQNLHQLTNFHKTEFSIGDLGPNVQMLTLGYLDLFCCKVKFGNLGFSIGESENNGFFRNY